MTSSSARSALRSESSPSRSSSLVAASSACTPSLSALQLAPKPAVGAERFRREEAAPTGRQDAEGVGLAAAAAVAACATGCVSAAFAKRAATGRKESKTRSHTDHVFSASPGLELFSLRATPHT
eukprot:6198368-Pleurochrysis_carterae.AAC.1